MLEIVQLDENNFPHFIKLLHQRGEAPEDYYRWKYLEQPANSQPTGFIAYLEHEPVGCIGIINRTFCATDGKDYPATWFADWFVTKSVRGKGIGELLMSEVRKKASYNFGVPGPRQAQVVCKKSGYNEMPGFSQYSFYVNSFRCGYKRFAGSGLVKFLRGVRSGLFSLPAKLNFHSKNFSELIIKLQNEESNTVDSSKGFVNNQCLKRNTEFMHWLKRMPVAEPAKRQWWCITMQTVYAFGYIETDFWGLRKAVILDIHATSISECIWNISYTLSKVGVDWILISYFMKSLTLKHWSKTAIPLYAATPKPLDGLHLTDLDKDSSWRNFLFA